MKSFSRLNEMCVVKVSKSKSTIEFMHSTSCKSIFLFEHVNCFAESNYVRNNLEKLTRRVSSIIPSARPAVPPLAKIIISMRYWVCFTSILKSGDGRTDGQEV